MLEIAINSSRPVAKRSDRVRKTRRILARNFAWLLALVAGASVCAAPNQGWAGESHAAGAAGKCPVSGAEAATTADARHKAAGVMSNYDWWPNQLNLRILHQNPPAGNPLGRGFNLTSRNRF